MTVIAPNSRMDLALPEAVPLAELLPAVLHGAGGGLAEEGLRHGGWAVQRLGGGPLDTARSPAELGIRDGETLYLRPRRDQLPEAAFDDVVDAVAVALSGRADRWRHGTSRLAALTATAVLLALGLATLVLAGPQWIFAAAVAATLLAGAGALSRGVGDGVAGAVLGVAAAPYAFLAGTGLLPPGAASVLVGFAAALVAVVLGGVLVGAVLPVFLAAGLVVACAVVGGLVALVSTPAGAAAVVAALVLALTPPLPMIAYRISALPLPFLPSGAQDMRRDDEQLPGAEALRKAVVADQALTGLVAGGAAVTAGCAAFLVLAPGWAGGTLAGLLAALLWLRSRLFTGRAQRLWLLGAGLVAVLAVALRLARTLPGPVVLLPVLGLVVVLLAVAVRDPDKRRAGPLPGRLADLAETLGVLAVVPVGLAVLDVYTAVRALWG